MKYFSFWSTGIRVRWNIWEGYIIAATIRPIFKLTKPSVASLTICTSFFIRRIEIMNTCSYILIDFLCLVVYTVYILIHPYLSSQKSDLLILSLIILIPNVDFMKMLTSMKHINLFIINDYLFMICTFFIVAVWLVFHEVILNKLSNQLINFWIFSYK